MFRFFLLKLHTNTKTQTHTNATKILILIIHVCELVCVRCVIREEEKSERIILQQQWIKVDKMRDRCHVIFKCFKMNIQNIVDNKMAN